VEVIVFKQGLAQPVSDNNLSVHALMSVNIRMLVQLIRLWSANSAWSVNQGCQRRLFFLIPNYFVWKPLL